MTTYDGTDDFEGVITSDQLNKTVMWRGTALPVGAANKIPQNGTFLLVDSLSAPTLGTLYVQTSATLSTPSFVEIPLTTASTTRLLFGLKAYWKFNEASGDIENQSISEAKLGVAADLQTSGVTYSETGKIGNAVTLDGTNDHMVAGSSLSQFNFLHNTTYEFTISFWAKILNWAGTDMIIDTASDISSSTVGLGIRTVSTDGILIHFSNGTNMNRFATTVTGFNTDGAYHHYVITGKKSDTTNSMEIWEDGVSMGSASNSGKDFVDTNATKALYFGQTGASSQYLNMTIDEAAIWSRRLSDTEIALVHNSGSGIEL